MSIPQNLAMPMLNSIQANSDSGKGSLRMKRALEEQWQEFSSSLEYEKHSQPDRQAKPDTMSVGREYAESSITQKALTDGRYATVLPVAALDASEAGLALSLRSTGDYSTLNIGANVNESSNTILNSGIKADRMTLGAIHSALQSRVDKYKKTNMTLTASDKGMIIWLRDFQGNLETDMEEIVAMMKDFFHEQNIKLKTIMLNGELFREMGE